MAGKISRPTREDVGQAGKKGRERGVSGEEGERAHYATCERRREGVGRSLAPVGNTRVGRKLSFGGAVEIVEKISRT